MFMRSLFRDEGLGAEHFRGCLIQDLPSHCWIAVADLRELRPEFTTLLLNPRGWDVLARTLITRGLNRCRLLHAWIIGLAVATL